MVYIDGVHISVSAFEPRRLFSMARYLLCLDAVISMIIICLWLSSSLMVVSQIQLHVLVGPAAGKTCTPQEHIPGLRSKWLIPLRKMNKI